MKNIILHWKPELGPDQVLNVQIELGMNHPKRNKTPYLAMLKVTENSTHMSPSPGFSTLPELTEKEVDMIEAYAQVFWTAYFSVGDVNVIWMEDEEG